MQKQITKEETTPKIGDIITMNPEGCKYNHSFRYKLTKRGLVLLPFFNMQSQAMKDWYMGEGPRPVMKKKEDWQTGFYSNVMVNSRSAQREPMKIGNGRKSPKARNK